MPTRVIHFEVQADDIKRAKTFYEKTFGWKVDKMMDAKDSKGGMDYWGLTTGEDGVPGINGGMYQRSKDKAIYTFDCTIQVDNIDEAIEAIKENGGKVLRPKDEIPGVGWFSMGVDTEGNNFGIMRPTVGNLIKKNAPL